jgi:CBS-domain-containing membrane protein
MSNSSATPSPPPAAPEATPPSTPHLRLTRASSAYVCVGGFISIGAVAAIALLSGSTFIFPSLGATAFLQLYVPQAPVASPRNTILGHACGIVGGAIALLVTGLWALPHVGANHMSWQHVLAAALSMAISGGLMSKFSVGHPAAAATALIVSLGLIDTLQGVVLIEVAVVLLTAIIYVTNHLAGVKFPLWAAPAPGAHLAK